MFQRFVGIDYSGASAPDAGLPGLRVYVATADAPPAELRPDPDRPSRHWSRRALSEKLEEILDEPTPAIVGIDHAFSFPLDYYDRYGIAHDWRTMLDDFVMHWPTHVRGARVEDLRANNARTGESTCRRLTDRRTGAKSPFHFDVPGSVAKSTHAGIPFLRRLIRRPGERVHAWPFDGWEPAPGDHLVAEAYPAMVRPEDTDGDGLSPDQRDARAVCEWLRAAYTRGTLDGALIPDLSAEERRIARVEGWILGAT